MPELANLQHEKFARALVTAPSQTAAYAEVYKTEVPETAKVCASQLLTNPNVKERVRELLNASNLGLAPITSRLGKWVFDDEHASVSLDAIKTAYKLHGVLDAEDKSSGIVAVQINIGNLSAETT
jgi:hypothetical protein